MTTGRINQVSRLQAELPAATDFVLWNSTSTVEQFFLQAELADGNGDSFLQELLFQTAQLYNLEALELPVNLRLFHP